MPRPRRRLRALLTPATAAVLAAALLPTLAATSSQAVEPAGPDSDELWSATSVRLQDSFLGHERRVTPAQAQKYTLNGTALDGLLEQAPREGTAAAQRPVRISIPAPSGELVEFDVVESSIMEPGLAAAHPEISTYAGSSVSDPTVTVRLDVTPLGFHASVRTLQSDGASSWYVDPAYQGDDSVYLSYFGKSLPAPEKPLIEPGEIKPDPSSKLISQGTAARAGIEVVRRTYRLALVTDPSYANYFGTENVFAEKATLMNRVNQIYNDDLAIRMVLINETDKLNLDTTEKAEGKNGPCGSAPCYEPGQLEAGCTGTLLNRNRTVLGQLVDASDYDIGHIALGINGGGIAGLGVVGGDGKARGCTGLPNPTGDFMAIDYVAHEMGHQFSGNHTFNGTQGACAGNKAPPSVEPGSGSSVMAYAGICGSDDLQPHTDPFFSHASQQEMTNYVTSERSPINEVQTVSLRDFDTAGESFTLTYKDRTTEPIMRGTTYNTALIKAALDAIVVPTGATVTVTGWNNSIDPVDDRGFTVTFNEPGPQNRPSLQLNPGAGVGGFVGETAQGGPVENQGFETQMLGNHAPVVSAPVNKAIPIRTPFTLTGAGSDVDGDSLIYLWEQKDRGVGAGTALQDEMKTNGPIFRIFGKYANVTDEAALEYESPGQNSAGGNPSRTFPDMQQVLAGETNAETGACPAPGPSDFQNGEDGALADGPVLECFSEWLPTGDYAGSGELPATPALNFRLTARDLDAESGGYGFDDTKLTIDKTAGPFLVTALEEAQSVKGADEGTVTWEVAGTDKPMLAENVRISLSTDGGETFSEVLAGNTPNDGSQTIEWPNVDTDEARLKVEAVGNYFFDVNDAAFTIVASDLTAPETTITSGPKDGKVLLTDSVELGFASTEAGSTFECTLDGEPTECNDGAATFTEMSRQTHRFSVTATDAAGNRDESPATLTWTVPQDDRDLRDASGEFRRGTADQAYLGTFTSSRTKGSTLKRPVEDATRLVLVAGKGPNHGSVSVYLGGRLLDSVSLRSDERMAKKRITVATFDEPRSGVVRIVVDRNKPVRIDGLGVVASP